MMRRMGAALLFSIVGLAACAVQGNQPVSLEKIKLPPGFSISVYASGVRNAREMALGPGGTLFVGSMNAGNVYAVIDSNKDNAANEVIEIASGLNMPNGVAVRNGSLYVAEVSRITRYDDIESHLKSPPKPVVVNDKFPHEEHHGWKFIAFGPDGMGDNVPPDELNYAPNKGMHFGYPYCHAGTIQDPEIGGEPCSKFTPPAITLTPHGASMYW